MSKALEISSSDDCIAKVANLISNDETLSDELREAAMEIKAFSHTFSPLRVIFSKGFRPRLSNRSFVTDFDSLNTSSHYTGERISISLRIVHDVEGLASLLGGKDALSQKLDDFSSTKKTDLTIFMVIFLKMLPRVYLVELRLETSHRFTSFYNFVESPGRLICDA